MTFTNALYFLKVIDKDFKPGLRLLHELYVSLREAEKLAADDEVLGAEVDYLERDYVTYLSLAESLQALHVGEAALTAMLNDEENLKMDVVFFALDKFKEAEVLSKGEDVELLCMALTKTGMVYLDVSYLHGSAFLLSFNNYLLLSSCSTEIRKVMSVLR